MSTTDWPTGLVPNAVQWQLVKSGVQFSSPFNGTVQAVETLAERWGVSLTLPPAAAPGQVGALINNLAGGVNRVNLYHHGQPQPRGTLRGSPTLGAGAARGDASITLAGAWTANPVLAPQGLDSALWTKQSSTITANVNTAPDGTTTADAIIEGTGDGAGAGHGVRQSITLAAGTYTVSWSVNAIERTRCSMWVFGAPIADTSPACFDTATMGVTGTGSPTITAHAASGFKRCTRQITLSAAGSITLHIGPQDATTTQAYTGDGASRVAIWGVQIDPGTTARDYTGLATLKAGDFLGCSGHLLQVAADCTATDLGAMTVALVNRIRSTIASGTAVTWYRPTAQFVMPAMQGGAMQVPGMLQAASIDLIEVY